MSGHGVPRRREGGRIVHAGGSGEVASGLWLRTKRSVEVGCSKARGIPVSHQEDLPHSQLGEGHTLYLTRGRRLEQMTSPCPAGPGDPTLGC